MQVNAGKLQLMTAAAIIVLISGGIAVYAQNQFAPNAPVAASGGSGSGDNNSSSSSMFTSSESKTTFSTSTSTRSSMTSTENHTLCAPPSEDENQGKLTLPITAAGSSTSLAFSNGRGCVASITDVGGVVSVQIMLRFAKPMTEYNAVLVANGTNYTLGNMVTGRGGEGTMQNQVLLKNGTYTVSIQLFDTSSTPGTSTLALQTGQGTITSAPSQPGGDNDDGSGQQGSGDGGD